MRGLFVTGTDTDVGKTFISSAILRTLRAQGHRVGAYKPVCSGSVTDAITAKRYWGDVRSLSDAIGQDFPSEWICPQCFDAPLAPPVAAEMAGKEVDEPLLARGIDVWRGQVDGLVVEGVGGWKCPLSNSLTISDFAVTIQYPVLIVASLRLGTINHTLLTIDAVRRAGLHVAGAILNQVTEDCEAPVESNAQQILRFGEVPFLAVAGFGHHSELRCWETSASIDWWNVLMPPSSENTE